MRKIDRIYLHHSESPPSTTYETINKWHKAKGWAMCGYHYVIQADGSIHKGREDNVIGAHVKWDNAASLGVCLTGDFDIALPHPYQIEKLIILLQNLCKEHNIKPENILGHRDGPQPANNKTCPGKLLYEMLSEIRNKVVVS